MNARRQLAVAFFSAVIVAVLGVIIYIASVNAGQTVQIWVVKTAVSPGSLFTSSNSVLIPVKAQAGDFTFNGKNSDGSLIGDQPDGSPGYVFTVPLSPGDVISNSVLEPATQAATIVLKVAGSGQLTAPGYADVYAVEGAAGGSGSSNATGPPQLHLVAHAAQVVAVANEQVTLLSKSSLTAEWATLQADANVSFLVEQSYPGTPPPPVICNGDPGSNAFIAALQQSACVSTGPSK